MITKEYKVFEIKQFSAVLLPGELFFVLEFLFTILIQQKLTPNFIRPSWTLFSDPRAWSSAIPSYLYPVILFPIFKIRFFFVLSSYYIYYLINIIHSTDNGNPSLFRQQPSKLLLYWILFQWGHRIRHYHNLAHRNPRLYSLQTHKWVFMGW